MKTPAIPPSRAKRIELEPHRGAAPERRQEAPGRAADECAEADQLSFHGTAIGTGRPVLYHLLALVRESLGEERQAEKEAAVDAAVTAVEELEVHGAAGCAGGEDRVVQGDGAEVEPVLVVSAAVDPGGT